MSPIFKGALKGALNFEPSKEYEALPGRPIEDVTQSAVWYYTERVWNLRQFSKNFQLWAKS